MVEVTKITSSSPTSAASSGTVNLQTDDNQPKSDQPTKKGRNRPGMPDPDAEVVALSPKSLLATNRFVCEICSKGFQRDQNLQLHRRGHNLPWRLRQRTSTEVRKRVYVCPEPTCVHHEPSRALGDLTGIKKHFSRKHGEKKFKCQKCEKKYAVQSDWKAHSKTCGTKEYRCDCGTLFSRRDSFITHRAFCDALARESARSSQPPMTIPASSGDRSKPPEVAPPEATSSPPPPPLTPSTGVLSPVLSIQSSAELLQENQTTHIPLPPPHATLPALSTSTTTTTVITTTSTKATTAITSTSSSSKTDDLSQSNSIFTNILDPSEHLQNPETCVMDPVSLSLSSSLYATSSLLQPNLQRQHQRYISGPQPALSATALLQKAAQIGATSSSSFLRGLGVSVSSNSSIPCQETNSSTMASVSNMNWSSVAKLDCNSSMASRLELGLPCSGSSPGFGEFMMGQSGMFGNRPATLDFLGLGSNEAFLSSINGELDLSNAEFSRGETWDGSSEAKQSML